MVQSPAWTGQDFSPNHPIVRPPVNEETLTDGIHELWPKLVAYSPQTDYVETFVQPDLSLGIQYNYHFNFELSARNSNGRGTNTPDGWYQLQVAVIKKSRDSIFNEAPTRETSYSRYVTSTSALVKISGGSFAHKISMRFPDPTMVALKHHLYIELIPLDNKCLFDIPGGGPAVTNPCLRTKPDGSVDISRSQLKADTRYKPYLIEMPFVPRVTAGSKMSDTGDVAKEDLPYSEVSLADYIAKSQLEHGARLAAQAKRGSSPAEYARKNKLHLVTPDDELFKYVEKRWGAPGSVAQFLRGVLNKRSSGPIQLTEDMGPLFSSICEALMYKNEVYLEEMRNPRPGMMGMSGSRYGDVNSLVRLCQTHARFVFRMTRVTHVGKPVANEVRRISQRPLSYNIMQNFVVSRGRSEDTYSSVTFKPLQIFFKFLEGFGMNLGFIDVSITNSVSSSQGESAATIASMMTSLDFSYVVLNIPTIGTQQCLEIRPVMNNALPFYDSTKDATNGFYVCDRVQRQKVDIPEVYAHVFQRCTDSAILDCYDPLTQVINFGLRGEREMSAFLYTVRKNLSPTGDNRLPEFQNYEGAERFFSTTPMTDRLKVITPVEFPKEGIPSFMAKLMYAYQEKFD